MSEYTRKEFRVQKLHDVSISKHTKKSCIIILIWEERMNIIYL